MGAKPVPLSDGAGDVVAIGPGVTKFNPGDRVSPSCMPDWTGGHFDGADHRLSLGFSADGLLSEYVLLHENAFVALPDYLSYEEAAALPCAAVSAWSALTFGLPLHAGHTVLIQGTGGVALFGLQIARMFGARVLAITSSEDKVRKLMELGAAAVVNYRETPDWGAAILKLTGGRGVDKVVEIGGESTIQQSINCTRVGGEIGLVGFVTGVAGGLPPMEILKKSITIKGISIGSRQSFEAMLAAMAATQVRPVLDLVYPFRDYKDAYRRLESAGHIGKIVIRIGDDDL
jgi:NADPH:quinone reductase-like Zn-dependent oxidoreductase